MEAQYIAPKCAAQIMGMSTQTVNKYVRLGKIPSKRIGRNILIPKNFMEKIESGERKVKLEP